MKYKYFILRSVNLVLVLGLLGVYQFTLYLREQEKSMTQLQTKVSQLEAERDAFIQQFKDSGGDEAGSDTDGFSDGSVSSVWADGTYTGSAEGFGGSIEVSVTIDSGKISAIDILSAEGEDEAYLSMGKDIVSTILEQQSTEVDTVSGATYSSTGIKNAVAKALEEAVK